MRDSKLLIEQLELLEEFENPTKSGVLTFILGFLPIINILNIHTCIKKRALPLYKKIIYYGFAVFSLGGLLTAVLAYNCLDSSRNETLEASKYGVFFTKLMEFIKTLKGKHQKQIKKLTKTFDPDFKGLSIKYKEVNDANKEEVSKDYADIIEKMVIAIMKEIKSFINEYQDGPIKNKFSELESEARKIK